MEYRIKQVLDMVVEEGLAKAMLYYSSLISPAPKQRLRTNAYNTYTPKGQGTASFQNTTNLDVADRFILLASGSNTTGDGGIVIQQGTNGIGEGFGYDSAETRWGVTGSFDGSQATFVPDAFMAAVVVAGAGVNDPSTAPARYVKDGNMFIADNGEIYIYS